MGTMMIDWLPIIHRLLSKIFIRSSIMDVAMVEIPKMLVGSLPSWLHALVSLSSVQFSSFA